MKISQSIMKEFKKYFYSAYSDSYKNYEGNNCGLLFKAKYIDKILVTEPSASMAEGIYFEYLATGSLPRSGVVPMPERTQKGELTAGYKRVAESAAFFKKLIEHYGIKILNVGYVLQTDTMTGTLDLIAEWDGEPCIIDLKWSGLLEDKWSELGWNTDSLPTKENLMIQGVHYKILALEAMGLDMPFYFWVFNSKDSTDMKIIRQEVDEDQYEQHKLDVLKMQELIDAEIKKGFKALPNYKNCKDCQLRDTCTEKHEFPVPVTVYYGSNV